jgi:hypothetical protein
MREMVSSAKESKGSLLAGEQQVVKLDENRRFCLFDSLGIQKILKGQ